MNEKAKTREAAPITLVVDAVTAARNSLVEWCKKNGFICNNAGYFVNTSNSKGFVRLRFSGAQVALELKRPSSAKERATIPGMANKPSIWETLKIVDLVSISTTETEIKAGTDVLFPLK